MAKSTGELQQIPLDKLDRNPENPRIFFRQQEMEELTESIRRYGVQVPISAYATGDRFIIIDGERRFRCSKKLNTPTIPAIVQSQPDPLQNLLLMFNIHALREQWDLLTIAVKLPRIIELYRERHSSEPNEKDLAEHTGLSRSAIRRSRLLMELPPHHIDLIRLELEKPKHLQRLSEDFYIEMERSLSTVQNRMPDLIPDDRAKETIREVLVSKYKDEVIKNVTDFRMLAKMARPENVSANRVVAEKALRRVFQPNKVSIDEAYKKSVQPAYSKRELSTVIESLIDDLENMERPLNDRTIRELLEQLVEVIGVILREKK
jgi:ParB/RepB/Spo0J family partition protein